MRAPQPCRLSKRRNICLFYTCDFSYTISQSATPTEKGPGRRIVSHAGKIYVGFGANIPSAAGPPRKTVEAAIKRLRRADIVIVRQSPWYKSPAFPDPAEPDFVNGVIEVDTRLDSAAFLAELHAIERYFGRIRKRKWEPRTLDLDLLDFKGELRSSDDGDALNLPHPRMQDRDWVLLPLRDVAPDWRHPRSGVSVDDLIAGLTGPLTAAPIA